MPGQAEIARRDRFWTITLALLVVGFGVVVLWKQALMKRPQGDFGVFARAGWAVRHNNGALYRVQDDNVWHYNYPPLFAILMAPFADPPRRDVAMVTASALGHGGSPLNTLAAFGACPNPLLDDHGRYLPYWLSCALFYLANVGMLFAACHLLAGAIERCVPAAADAGEANRRWWWWRVAPALACAPAVGLNLMRGQVQIILLLLVVGTLVGLVRGRRFAAGLCLAGAIVLKVFPAFLLLVPLARRDVRCLAGCGVGLVLGLFVLPVVVLGPEQTTLLYADFGKLMLGPALGLGIDELRADELLNATATQSQSFQVVLHKTLHLGIEKVPPEPARWVKVAHLLIGGSMTLALLVRGGGFRRAEGLALVGRFGLLTTLMVLVSPVCHLHYLVLIVPMVTVMIAKREADQPGGAHRDLWAMALALTLALALPMLPGLGVLRNVGVPMYAVLWWWFAGLATRWEGQAGDRQPSLRAAA
ncbi:MAG: glycosyltransferase family 87 protein [Gemmataceae bacterium]